MTFDDQDIERIAAALARHLADHAAAAAADHGVRLVDAATVARRLGVTRNWVYAHADQLGAIRLGSGRGRLRFDLAKLPVRVARDEKPAPLPMSNSWESLARPTAAPTLVEVKGAIKHAQRPKRRWDHKDEVAHKQLRDRLSASDAALAGHICVFFFGSGQDAADL